MEWNTQTPAPPITRTDIAPASSPIFDAARSPWATSCTRCPRQDSFSGNFPQLVAESLPESAKSKPLEIWFQDEARVGQQGTLTRVWAQCGSRPRAPRDQRYEWAYIFGAVCPARQATAALVLPNANAEARSLHLAEIGKQVAVGAHAVLLLDGAGYHKAAALNVPANISLLKLPPYAPELNPAENIWEYLRGNGLANTVFDSYDDIVDKSCEAWVFLANDPARIASVTTREWAQVTQVNN